MVDVLGIFITWLFSYYHVIEANFYYLACALFEGKLGTFYNTYVTFQSLLQASQTIPNTSITYFKMTVSFNRWQSVKLKFRFHMLRYFSILFLIDK